MPIVLFAVLGASAGLGAGYWICFAIYCVLYAARALKEAADKALW